MNRRKPKGQKGRPAQERSQFSEAQYENGSSPTAIRYSFTESQNENEEASSQKGQAKAESQGGTSKIVPAPKIFEREDALKRLSEKLGERLSALEDFKREGILSEQEFVEAKIRLLEEAETKHSTDEDKKSFKEFESEKTFVKLPSIKLRRPEKSFYPSIFASAERSNLEKATLQRNKENKEGFDENEEEQEKEREQAKQLNFKAEQTPGKSVAAAVNGLQNGDSRDVTTLQELERSFSELNLAEIEANQIQPKELETQEDEAVESKPKMFRTDSMLLVESDDDDQINDTPKTRLDQFVKGQEQKQSKDERESSKKENPMLRYLKSSEEMKSLYRSDSEKIKSTYEVSTQYEDQNEKKEEVNARSRDGYLPAPTAHIGINYQPTVASNRPQSDAIPTVEARVVVRTNQVPSMPIPVVTKDSPSSAKERSIQEQVSALKAFRDEGVLSEQEFLEAEARIYHDAYDSTVKPGVKEQTQKAPAKSPKQEPRKKNEKKNKKPKKEKAKGNKKPESFPREIQEQLDQIRIFRDQGLISKEEYEDTKRQIIGSVNLKGSGLLS